MHIADNCIYISGSLAMASNPAANVKLYERMAVLCQNNSHTVCLPHRDVREELEENPDPVALYEAENAAVNKAKGMIVFVYEASFGTAMELMLAAECAMPILCLCPEGTKVSRYLKGFLLKYGYGDIVTYTTPESLDGMVVSWLDETYPLKAAV